ncbi:hypothetical protein LJC74_08275 [Eubacteriales bacterium OttesenSCG-928-A19]|nr:hypothetical protein [Eubacteriales bacterium OttesenSCG-928-A19]
MRQSLFAACLVLLLLVPGAMALSEADGPSYGIKGRECSLFAIFIQPDDDAILCATGFDTGDAGFQVDNSIIRVSPEGEIRWIHHMPYISEVGGGNLIALSDGRYATSVYYPDEDYSILSIFDAEEGFLSESGPIKAASFLATNGHIIGLDSPSGTSGLRLTWVTNDGDVEKRLDYAFDLVPSNVYFVEAGEGLILMCCFEGDGNRFMLTRVRQDGTVDWQYVYRSPIGSMNDLRADGQGGAYVMCDPGLYHDRNYVMRVDAEGNELWGTELVHDGAIVSEIAADARGYHLILDENETVQLLTLTPDGGEIRHPKQRKPEYEAPDTMLRVREMFTLSDGDSYFFGYVHSLDQSRHYGADIIAANAPEAAAD